MVILAVIVRTVVGLYRQTGATGLTVIRASVGGATFPLWNQRRIEIVPAVLVANLQTALDLVFGENTV
jgi:hypothetical protein